MALQDQIPSHTNPSSHNRIGEEPLDPVQRSKQANLWGFPVPGEQNPSATSVMVQDYFVRLSSLFGRVLGSPILTRL